MSSLWRSIYIKGVNSKLTFLKPKGSKVCNVARCNESSMEKSEKLKKYIEARPWVSYGFDYKDERLDRHYMHLFFFGFITVCLVWGSMIAYYLPDTRLRDWAHREAYIRLRYREENGLPLIDPNLIDPTTFTLPSDEELGYTEIII